MKNKNGIIVCFIAILAALCILFSTKSNNSPTNSFLVSDKLISTSDSVPSNMPDGYVFLSNGKYAYYNFSFETGQIEEENGNKKITYNRMISSIGTWKVNDDKLILKVEKEEYAVGGQEIDEPPYPYLSDYKRETKNVNKEIEYTINEIDSSDENLPFLSLTLDNQEIKWYGLSIGEYLNTPKELAKNGYSDKYYQLVK